MRRHDQLELVLRFVCVGSLWGVVLWYVVLLAFG